MVIVHKVMKTKTTEVTARSYVGHSFLSKEQVSFSFMAAVTNCSDFGAQENKIHHCFHFIPIHLPGSDGTDPMIFAFFFFF